VWANRLASFEEHERRPRIAEVPQIGGENGVGEEHGLFALLMGRECLSHGALSACYGLEGLLLGTGETVRGRGELFEVPEQSQSQER
jgi:hypothetical protein